MKECPTCQRCFADTTHYCPADGGQLTFTLAGEPVLDGRYQLRRRLGQGGMGVVYKARHVFLKTTHAIKVILPELVGGDPEFLTRFRQEAMAAAAIRHHNVVSVTDYGVINNSTPFLVMEFIQGKSLQDIIEKEKRMSPARALEVLAPAAAGVAAAHRRGIVHRDLKPLNIIVEDDLPLNEAVKVLDFGLAKIKSGELLGSFVAAKTTGLMGSPHYMAPEQWSDEEPERGADIYSLGIILYQMLAGDVPFKGPSIPSVMKKHLMDKPPPISELGASVPPLVEAVVRRALEKDAENRPATVPDFIHELRYAVTSSAGRQVETPAQDTDMLATLSRATLDQMAGTISNAEIDTPHGMSTLSEEQARREELERLKQEATEARRLAEEEQRRHEEVEAARKAEAEAARQRALEEEARRRAAEEERLRREAEAARQREEEERRKREEEERRQREEEEQRRREEEEKRQREEEERLRREEEERRQREEEEQRQREEEERRRAEEEERERQAAEAARLKAEEEARLRAEEEERQRLEAEAKRLQEEEERKRAEEEEARRAEEEEQRQREEKKQRKREEKERQKREEKEERQRLEAEAARQQEEEEQRQREAEEARRRAEDEEAARRLEEEERLRREEEERQRIAAAEATRKQAEEEAERQRRESEEQRQREEEERRQREEEERLRREEEERRQREEEEQRQREEEERRRAEEEERERQAAEAARLKAEEEARLRAEEEERQLAEEEERRRREEEEERQRIEAEATPPLAEETEALSAEEEERQRAAQEEEDAREAFEALEARRRRRLEREGQLPQETEEAAPVAPPEVIVAPQPEVEEQPLLTEEQPLLEDVLPAPGVTGGKKTVLALAAGISAGIVVILMAGVAIFLSSRTAGPEQENGSKPPSNSASPEVKGSPTKAPLVDMVAFTGGTYQMGRSDVDPEDESHGNEYPAHAVAVKPFQMDKTEVTNAEYAEFVKATKYPAPRAADGDKESPDWKPWVDGKPPAGQERWPVRNVSVRDAEAFAAWRSQRDGVRYRLPTEEEWEYAARSSGAFRLYPWGDEGPNGRANVDSSLPEPVGSFAPGASREGLLDMIGNVWEWTASEISIYAGNDKLVVDKENRGQRVIRGGSYQSKARGGEAITAASRTGLPPTTKDHRLGFRLVRDGP